MSQNVAKIFQLNIDGSFDEIAYENIKEVFTILNILAIYITTKKIMYIWIGRNATQALKHHISNIRVLVKEEFPDFRIIRNFTYEMRGEPSEFFKNLDIDKEELYKFIDYQEKIMLPTIRKIDSLKKITEKFVGSEDYSKAIKNSEEIIKLANEIDDDALVTEQKRFITEITAKSADKRIIDEIKKETMEIEKEFSKLIDSEEFLKAHRIVEEFKKRNSKRYDLSIITSVTELFSKEERIWKKEQERLVQELTTYENDLFLAIKNLEIENAIKIMERGKSLFTNLINEEIKKKWSQLDDDLQNAKQKAELIKNIESFIIESDELKDNFQFSALEKGINDLLIKVRKHNIPNYQKKLEDLETKIISTKLEYNNKLIEIDALEKSISKKQKSNLIDDVLSNCQQIIQIAQSINKSKVIQKYSIVLKQTEKAIEDRKVFEENQKKLKQELSTLEKNLNAALKVMDISKLEKIVDKSKILLIEFVGEEIKKNWISLENKYHSARALIENIEKLSEMGLSTLNERSYSESLSIYEQIIDQIQNYNK
jgi:hypothetical protein